MPVRDTIAKAFASADREAVRRSEEVRARTMEWMFNPAERDDVHFYQALEAANIDAAMWIDITPEELNEIDPEERTIDWMGIQAAIAAASVQQARLELVYRPLMETASRGAEAIVRGNARLTNDQRKVAATEGTGKARFEAAARDLDNGG